MIYFMKSIKNSLETSKIVRKLEKEKRYLDILERYPAYVPDIRKLNIDSCMETGKKFNMFKYIFNDLVIYKNFKYYITKLTILVKKAVCYIIFVIYLGVSLGLSALGISRSIDHRNTYKKYKEKIIEYDAGLEKYASQFDNDTMSEMEIIMSVMNDIRSNTKYGQVPDGMEVPHYYRLALNEQNDIGVCRHMADKFTATMNKIDPRYQAFNLSVKLEDARGFTMCDVERPFKGQDIQLDDDLNEEDVCEDSENNEDSNTQENNEQKDENGTTVVTNTSANTIDQNWHGNHLISVIKPIGKDYYLVIDATNPSIGVLKNGKIYMFNSKTDDVFEYKPIGQYGMSFEEGLRKANVAFLQSNFQSVDLEELEELYGLEAQNETLTKIKK